MSLILLLILPVIGAGFTWAARDRMPVVARAAMLTPLALNLLILWALCMARGAAPDPAAWMLEWSVPWAPALGLSLSLAIDGLSLLFAVLTCVLGIVAAVLSWDDHSPLEGMRRALHMLLVSALLGVFLVSDLLLFFVFYEAMLLPVFALILLGNHPKRAQAATRFFLFTQAGGLFMLVAMLVLYVMHGQQTGEYTFAYRALLQTDLSPQLSMLVLIGFFLAFAVKLPLVPLHTWQADAYEATPSGGAILLGGVMAKAAGYGLIRFALPFGGDSVAALAPLAVGLGMATLLYTAWMAYGQDDLKRFIAFSSASHLAFVMLGVFAQDDLAMRGAVMQMFCHGFSVAGLFVLVHAIEAATGTRDLNRLSGLWHTCPRLGAAGLVFAMATLGLPGLGNFVGEFLVLAGLYKTYPVAAACGAVGAVLSAAYTLRMVQRLFYGPKPKADTRWDLTPTQGVLSAALVFILVWLGVFPQGVLQAAAPSAATESVAQGVEQ